MLEESYRSPYYGAIKERCSKLIDYRVWDGIDKNRLDAWLKNFDSDKDRFFAACILDHLVYRSEEQTISMLYDLLSRDLDNLFRLNGISLDKSPLELLRDKYDCHDPKFRIVSAVKPEDAASKSGYLMCNLIVHHLSVYDRWVITPGMIDREAESGIKIFVLLDDIICSGSQMKETIEKWNLTHKNDLIFCIAVCAAHEKGIHVINENYPNIKIAFTEKLKTEDSIFNHICLRDFDCETKEDIEEYYKTLMRKKNVRYGNLLGFANIALLYAFKHNVPNNCLPIIHYSNDTFSPLIAKKK